ncbi:hypothetical protein BVC93_32320 (plasmid) [Mycobacterium sp. MS1601]|nr:hypothetical protein BVC93_32320 [Mycobacterium sp. MS1601]
MTDSHAVRPSPGPDRAAVTGWDVARLAGVSQPTVSRALRGYAFVSNETRQRVLDAARELGYIPNAQNKPPVSMRAEQIAIVSTDWDSPFYPHLVAPMQSEFNAVGYSTVLFTEKVDDTLLLRRLVDKQIGGVIITSSSLESTIPRELTRQGFPVVLVHRSLDEVEADSCTMDNYYGGRLAATALLEAGHRHVGLICGPKNTNTGRDREAGFLAAFSGCGVPIANEAIRHGSYSYDTGYEEAGRLLKNLPETTAIFCGNDVIALGAHSRATAMGLQVPDDLSLIGFDDSPVASWGGFDLTTINCDVAVMAERGVAMLLERIADPKRPHQRVIVQPRLVNRRTVAPPRPIDRALIT